VTAARRAWPVLALLGACTPVQAQERAADAAAGTVVGDEVVVTGVRGSELDLDRLRRAQAVFVRERPTFAPTATLLFRLRAVDGTPVTGLTLTLRDGGRSLAVPVDADGRFALPDLPPGQWTLVHNRSAGRLAVRPLVLSAGASEADRPLGDFRLQCRVGWELRKSDFSAFARAAFGALGGCASRRIGFYFPTPRPVARATLVNGAEVRSLSVRKDRRSVRVPLNERDLPGSARVLID
jgi:hypothetical protein